MTESKTPPTRRRKPFVKELDEALARALLNRTPKEGSGEFETLFAKLRFARTLLAQACEEVQEALASNPLTEITAREAARKEGRRGKPTVTVDNGGRVILEIHYGKGRARNPKQERTEPLRHWSSDLPSLEELRHQADKLGVDISDLGRKKKLIMERLEGATPTVAPKPKPKPKMTKTAPAIGQVRVLNPQPAKAEQPSMATIAKEAIEETSVVTDLDEFWRTLGDMG